MKRWKCSNSKDSQKISLKLYSIVTHFVNFKHNFHKEIETFFKNKLKWIQENCFKMNPLSSELPFHVHHWLIISLKDFCIVIRKWLTFWPSSCDVRDNNLLKEIFLQQFDNKKCTKWITQIKKYMEILQINIHMIETWCNDYKEHD